MLISFKFSGSCTGEILEVFDTLQLKYISVNSLSIEQFKNGLNNGRYSIYFAKFYGEANKVENKISGFEVEEE